jgi:hypothetical protein
VSQNWCVVLGDPIRGVQVVGPFDNGAEAVTYGDAEQGNETWWVVRLLAPEEVTS